MTVEAQRSLGELAALPLGAELRGLELPQAHVVGPWRTRRPTRKAMLGGRSRWSIGPKPAAIDTRTLTSTCRRYLRANDRG
jgi:hypothetical protein